MGKSNILKNIVIFAAACLLLANAANVYAGETTASEETEATESKTYERYYQFKKYTSENGLDGTSVKCVMPSEEGLLPPDEPLAS